MRRFIAYTTLAASMLVAVGVAITPVLTHAKPGREFSNGREITFSIKSKDEDKLLPDNAVSEVAEIMKNRLDNLNFEDYSIKVQNNVNEKEGAITVSLACEKDTFNTTCSYLTFSGENFSFSFADNEAEIFDNPIKTDEVRIEQYNDLVPLVVLPITSEATTKLEEVFERSGESSGDTSSIAKSHIKRAEGEEEAPQEQPSVFLWANYEEGDSITNASNDPYMKSRIIMQFYENSIWFNEADGNTGDEHTAIKIVCGSVDESGQSYDFGKLKNANAMATYYKNMLQASAYDYEVSCPTANISGSTGEIDYFENSIEVPPYAGESEALFTFTNTINLKFTTTLITTLIAYVIIVGCLIAYFKLLSPAIIATTTGTTFLSFLVLIEMGGLLNIPAFVGGLIIAGVSLFGQIFYTTKFKEEVYKGRNFKKANQEASKKSNLITLDSSVITAFGGLMAYLLGGAALKPMGVVLFFGSLISLIMNLIVFKGLAYLACNSTAMQSNYKAFGIYGDKVPNVMLEQKPNYTHPLEQINYTKGSKVSSILLGSLSVISLVFILIFGISKGSPLNIFNATKDKAVAYVQIVNDDYGKIISEKTFKDFALKDVENIEEATVTMKNVETYNTVEEANDKTLFFTISIDKTLSNDEIDKLSTDIYNNLQNEAELDSEDIKTVSVLNSHELVYTPDQGSVALAAGITIAGACIYLMLRYRFSRGLSIAIVSAGATLSAYGIMVMLHVGTTAVTSLAMPIVAIVTLLAALPYLNIEKTLVKENHEDMSKETRHELMKKAISKSALFAFSFGVIEVFLSIIYFGFGMKLTTLMFVSTLIGELLGVASIYMIAGPLASSIEKGLAKVHLPKFKFLQKKENSGVQNKPKSSEPVETTFIGIND